MGSHSVDTPQPLPRPQRASGQHLHSETRPVTRSPWFSSWFAVCLFAQGRGFVSLFRNYVNSSTECRIRFTFRLLSL